MAYSRPQPTFLRPSPSGFLGRGQCISHISCPCNRPLAEQPRRRRVNFGSWLQRFYAMLTLLFPGYNEIERPGPSVWYSSAACLMLCRKQHQAGTKDLVGLQGTPTVTHLPFLHLNSTFHSFTTYRQTVQMSNPSMD